MCIGTCGYLAIDDWGEPGDDLYSWTVEFYTRAGSGT
jgi:hypothetical protein